jgi:hypothetical protein
MIGVFVVTLILLRVVILNVLMIIINVINLNVLLIGVLASIRMHNCGHPPSMNPESESVAGLRVHYCQQVILALHF